MAHVHLLDPQLIGVGGHYLSHDAQLLGELTRRGIPVSLYGRRDGKVATCVSTEVIPTFTHDIFREVGKDPVVWAMENFEQVNRDFLRDLQGIPVERFQRDDLVYFPNILQNQVLAVARWIEGLPEERRPTVALMFRYLNHAMDYVQARQNKELIALHYRFAVQHLRNVHRRSIICADTTELCKAYRQITGVEVLELPNPMDVSALLATVAARKPDPRPTIVYQGHTSPLRGFHFLPEIIVRSRSLNPRPRFAIQVQNRDTAASTGLGPVLAQLDQLKGDDVQLLEGALSQEDYLALLARADVVLLPYTPTFYGFGSSGVFTEAASIGKVVVACNGTVPARQGKDYRLGVIAADQWTPASLSAALASAVQRLPQLRAMSEAAAPKFRDENCSRVLWDKLLAAASAVAQN